MISVSDSGDMSRMSATVHLAFRSSFNRPNSLRRHQIQHAKFIDGQGVRSLLRTLLKSIEVSGAHRCTKRFRTLSIPLDSLVPARSLTLNAWPRQTGVKV